ncbi:unnamed protein product [Chrysoparadoxa australica]
MGASAVLTSTLVTILPLLLLLLPLLLPQAMAFAPPSPSSPTRATPTNPFNYPPNYLPLDRGVLDRRIARLHLSARKAVKHNKEEWARGMYRFVIKNWDSEIIGCALAQNYLLLALLEQKSGRVEAARTAFREGVTRCPTQAKLVQAWALFESKHGPMKRALALAKRCVELDKSLAGILRWKMFRDVEQMTLAS